MFFSSRFRTGDILLASTATQQAKCFRGVSGDKIIHRTHWDHVFFVLRRDYERSAEPIRNHKYKAKTPCDPRYCSCKKTWIDGEGEDEDFCLEVVDATTTGLHIFSFKGRLARLSSYYSHVAVRRLQGPALSAERIERLEKFLLSVRGMGFRIAAHTACALACHSTPHVSSSDHNERASLDGWFCTEITTRCLMELGVMHPSEF